MIVVDMTPARKLPLEKVPMGPSGAKRKQAPRGKAGVPCSWRIRRDQHEKVKRISERTGIPQAVIIERIIDRWLPDGWEHESPEELARRIIDNPVNHAPGAADVVGDERKGGVK